MSQKAGNEAIELLLKAIEDALNWGKTAEWSSYDFDKLAELIHERTGVVISSNTLKRLWGRIKYDSNPSDTTLNTLARCIGFDDFREFKSAHPGRTSFPGVPKKRFKMRWGPFTSRPSIVFASGAIFMLITLVVLSYSKKEEKLNPDDFYFTSRKVTKGLPNSVIFEYRAKSAPSGAKVEIQQSWDTKKRQPVAREDSLATAIYYDPGYFKAKLVVDGQVVKEHGILITSDGWKAKFENGARTLYLNDTSITNLGKVAPNVMLLEADGLQKNDPELVTHFRYVDDFNDLSVNDLVVETQFRNTLYSGLNVCQNATITLLMEGEAIVIPVAKRGCIAQLELWHLDRRISGENNDLSKLGVDFGNWVAMRCELKQDRLSVYINENKALELPMYGRINKIHGVIYRFEGTGEVKSLLLKNSEKTYFQWPKMPYQDIGQNY
ncbi:MAG: hypothetical protein AAF634_06035 [Bacteroidota bacterium]